MRTQQGVATLGPSLDAAHPVHRAADAAIHPATRNVAEWRSRAVEAEGAESAEACRHFQAKPHLLVPAAELDELIAVPLAVPLAVPTETAVERADPVLALAPTLNMWMEQVQERAARLPAWEPMARSKPALLRERLQACAVVELSAVELSAVELDAPVQLTVQLKLQLDAWVLPAAPESEAQRRRDAQQAWAAQVWAPDAEAAASESHQPMTPAGQSLVQRPAIRPPGLHVPELAWAAVVAEERPSLLPREPKRR